MILFGQRHIKQEAEVDVPAGGAAAVAPAPAAPVVATALAPTPAAPATPVAPAAPTAPATPAATDTVLTYTPTGDTSLDIALGFMGRAGFGSDHPAVQAATQGDFSLLAAALAEKGLPGWEQHLSLAKEAHARFAEKAAGELVAIQNVCIAAAGGEAEWGETLAWASANADPHEKEAVNAALAGGGVAAEAMAAWLVAQHRNAPGVTVPAAKTAVNPAVAAGRAGAPALGPLSPSQYAAEVAKIRQQGTIEGSREYAALQARRAAYRG